MRQEIYILFSTSDVIVIVTSVFKTVVFLHKLFYVGSYDFFLFHQITPTLLSVLFL